MVNEQELKEPVMLTTQQIFDNAYWAAQEPEVQALRTITDPDARAAQASALAMKGFTIDVPIMVWGWDPYLVMTMRTQFGYTWVPSALQQPIAEAPGAVQPGVVSYDPLHPPPGSIKVSVNLADYPPVAPPPAPVVAAPVTELVGGQSIGSIYYTVTGDSSPDGTKFTDARGTFVKHMVVTPFGKNAYWELLSVSN